MSSVHPLPPLPEIALRIARVQAFVFRAPIATPVRTSFGTMTDRPALLLRVEDADGSHGWGEVWCNFPGCGAEHRARVVETVLAPRVVGQAFASVQAVFQCLGEATAVLALQCGEPGPLAQAIAGLDLALWDLCARRAGQPLWRLLGGQRGEVPAYASGINPDRPEATVAEQRDAGHRAFKLKIGFGETRDLANLAAVRALVGPETPLMADANQAWPLAEAMRMLPLLEAHGLGWLEEPLRADRPLAEWGTLAGATRMPLAAGENVLGEAAFEALVASGAVGVVQPDLAKWGGVSGCWPVIARVRAAGLRYCPHYLGAGVGLLASAHVLAAAGGDGLLEIDVNPNPLRSALMGAVASLHEGRVQLGDEPGTGVEPALDQLRALCAQKPG